MKSKLNFYSVGACILLVLDGIAITGLWMQKTAAQRLLEHSHAVIETLGRTRSSVKSAESNARGYTNTGYSLFKDNSIRSQDKVEALLETLDTLIAAESGQRKRLLQLKELISEKFDWERQIFAIYQKDGQDRVAQLLRTLTGFNLMQQISNELSEMEQSENANLDKSYQESRVYGLLLLGAVSLLSLIAALALFEAIRFGKVSLQLEAQKTAAYERLEILNRELNTQVSDLFASRDELNRALQVRSEFLAKISHELRTPLAGVIGSTELALVGTMPEDERELVTIAKECGEMLLRLVNDILDFEMMERQEFQLRPTRFDLRRSIASALQPLCAKAKQKGIAFTWLVDPSVPAIVHGDRIRLQQILSNLVDNAIKFTDEGCVSVGVVVDSLTDANVLVRFTVADTGIGFSPEQSVALFDAFNQADNSSKRKYGGTGLGLSISKQLVELMKGKINCQSEPGHGSKFWFTVFLDRLPSNDRANVEQSDLLAVETHDHPGVVENDAFDMKPSHGRR